MGSKNPLKQITQAATDIITKPVSMAARAVGAGGIEDLANNVNRELVAGGDAIIDLANNEGAKQKAKADAENARQASAAAEAADQESKRVAAAEYADSESKRMSAGSKSRTLLTGPAGLEDSEDGTSITRRTLSAR